MIAKLKQKNNRKEAISMSKNLTKNLVNQVRKLCKLEAELAGDNGRINHNKLAPQDELKLKKIKNKIEASELEIEELILTRNTTKGTTISLKEAKKIRDDLFENELSGNGKAWQREGADILLAKLANNSREGVTRNEI